MSKWKHTVNFGKFWDKDIPVEEKGKLAAVELRKLKRYFRDDWQLDEIIDMFDCVSGDGEPPEITEFTVTEDFDARMHDLYDWADSNYVWVDTF